ncbi:hypothetical protein EBU99_14075 [bacterium]|nr:hypothetical protein [bacterium]
MFTGGSAFSSLLGTLTNGISVGLNSNGWTTMIKTKTATVTPTVCADQSRLVFNSEVTVAADNVASAGNQQIIKGTMKTGIVQDFTGDLNQKIDSTTIVTKCKKQDTCLKKALIKLTTATADSAIRTFSLQDVLQNQLIFGDGSIFICSTWAAGFTTLVPYGAFSPCVSVNLQQDVPYGVLPYFWFGDSSVQVVHVLLKWAGDVTGVQIQFVPQPFESLGCTPPKSYDGTWMGSIIYGTNNLSPVRLQNMSGIGLMRMFCPTSVPTISLQGLSSNVIYVNGSASATAPPANSIPESYGGRPFPLIKPEKYVETAQEAASNESELKIVDLY